MKKLILAALAAAPLLAGIPALAWENQLPGNARWIIDDDWSSYPPNRCQAIGEDFSVWHLVDDASLNQEANCVKVQATPSGPQLVLNPANRSTGMDFGPLGHGAFVESTLAEAGGDPRNFPSGSLFLRYTFNEVPRTGAIATDVGFPVWKFSVSGGGSTTPLSKSYYAFVPTRAGWSLEKTVNGITTIMESGSTPKYLPRRQHSVVIQQNYNSAGADIRIFTGGAIVNDRVTGLVRVVEKIDPHPLTIGRFGFGAVNAKVNFGPFSGQQF